MRTWRQHPKQNSGRPRHELPTQFRDQALHEAARAADSYDKKMGYVAIMTKRALSEEKQATETRGLKHPDELPEPIDIGEAIDDHYYDDEVARIIGELTCT